MNLRDKLRAVDGGAKKKTMPAPASTDCWQREHVHPLEEFPGALELCRETLMLMQPEELPQPLDPRRILYLDTETTGLGGSGTVAFEVGLGWLSDEGFTVRQYVMRDYPEERYLLSRLMDDLSRFDVLCTFNGRTFDVPLLRSRLIMNRMPTSCLDKPHIDLLHMARRVWRLRLQKCTLGHLEEQVLGIARSDDLPGSLVPERYFTYLKTRQFDLLEDVLRHNEQDIASLCVLLAHMAALFEHPEQGTFGEDVFAMGVALERYAHHEEARRCYRLVPGGRLHGASQLRLAGSLRRGGDRQAAREVWERMIRQHEGGVTPYIELAKYYEHVERDPDKALALTERALTLLAEPSLREDEAVQKTRNALQYRYDRLKRKRQSKGL